VATVLCTERLISRTLNPFVTYSHVTYDTYSALAEDFRLSSCSRTCGRTSPHAAIKLGDMAAGDLRCTYVKFEIEDDVEM
jgi:hypothetical protein